MSCCDEHVGLRMEPINELATSADLLEPPVVTLTPTLCFVTLRSRENSSVSAPENPALYTYVIEFYARTLPFSRT